MHYERAAELQFQVQYFQHYFLYSRLTCLPGSTYIIFYLHCVCLLIKFNAVMTYLFFCILEPLGLLVIIKIGGNLQD